MANWSDALNVKQVLSWRSSQEFARVEREYRVHAHGDWCLPTVSPALEAGRIQNCPDTSSMTDTEIDRQLPCRTFASIEQPYRVLFEV